MQNGGTKVQQFDLDDFNLNSGEALWDAPARDQGALGNKVISASESLVNNHPNTAFTPELGQIVNLEMPPTAEVENITEMPASQDLTPAPLASAQGKDPLSASLNLSFDKSAIKTTEKLNKSGVAAIRNVINIFHRQNNPKDFYDTVRGENGILDANLKRSYNRTLGES